MDDQDVCEPRDHGLAARTQLSWPRSPSVAACSAIHSTSGELHASTAITLGSSSPADRRPDDRIEPRRRRPSSGASPPVAQDFVPVAHLFARQIEELRAENARLARQPVASTVWHEGEVRPGCSTRSSEPFDIQVHTGLTSRHGTSGSPRDAGRCECPGRLWTQSDSKRRRSSVESAVLRQADRAPRESSRREYAPRVSERPDRWTNEHESATTGHCSVRFRAP